VRTTPLLAGILAAGLVAAAGAADAPAPEAAVDRLVEQLGSPDFRRRDEAARQLEARGVAALPALRKALNHPDAEVRRRANELIPALETAALLAPKRVTLKASNKPLRAVFDDLEKQTGYKIESWGGTDRRVFTFEFTDLPFWEALDRICESAGLVLQQGYGDDHIRLQHSAGHTPYVHRAGAFRFLPTGFQHYRNVNFGLVGKGGAAQRSESLTLSFTVFSEPKLPLLGMGEPKLDAAYDSDNNSMLLRNPSPDEMDMMRFGGRRWVAHYGPGYRALSQQTQVQLNRPSEKASSLKLVRGSIPVTLLVEQRPAVVADKVLSAKGKKTRAGTTDFDIQDVSELPGKQYQIKMGVSEDNKDNPNDYTWMNSLYQRVELQDAKGNKYSVVGSGWGNNGTGRVELTLTFSAQGNVKLGPPEKLVYSVWTTLQYQLPFEFRDLPLP
jgi:hypothetical protein